MATTNALDITMRREYEQDAFEAFNDPATKGDFTPTLGVETEYSVVMAGGTELVSQEVRDRIVAHDADMMGQELGEWQLEVKSRPVDLASGGFEALDAHLKECEARASRAARICGGELVRLGSYPLHPVDQIRRSRTRRYDQVVTWHDEHHNDTVPTFIGASRTTRPAGADIISLMNSVQYNWAARSAEAAVEMLNISLAVLPQIVAAVGNARFLDGIDTRYSDVRMLMWERTHDTRTAVELITDAPHRVGLPGRYFRDVGDYVRYVSGFPFIIDQPGAAFNVGTGLNWSDARLKVKDRKVLLEFRPISVQPSPEEDVAVCAFYIGLLEYHLAEASPLPPLAIVRNNRFMAMRDGLRAVFTEFDGVTARRVPARQVVEDGLEKAAAGLSAAGYDDGVGRLEVLRTRLRDMRAPSDDFAARIEQALSEGSPFEDALVKAVRGCVVRGEH